MAIAQEESDYTTMARVEEFVQGDFLIVADPSHASTKVIKRYGVYLIDKQGMIRVYLPGTKTARPRLDMIVNELAKMAGLPAPELTYEDGKIMLKDDQPDTKKHARGQQAFRPKSATEVLDVRWMWSHNVTRPGDDLKLAFCPLIAEGWHVYGAKEKSMHPFRVEFTFPKGLELKSKILYPKAKIVDDKLLGKKILIYEDDIPMSTIKIKASDTIKPGKYTATATMTFQACDGQTCLRPTQEKIEMKFTVVPAGKKRQQVYGWRSW